MILLSYKAKASCCTHEIVDGDGFTEEMIVCTTSCFREIVGSDGFTKCNAVMITKYRATCSTVWIKGLWIP